MEAKTDGRKLDMATQGQVRRLVVKAVRGGLKQGAGGEAFCGQPAGGEQVGGTGQGWRPTGAEVEASRSAARIGPADFGAVGANPRSDRKQDARSVEAAVLFVDAGGCGKL